MTEPFSTAVLLAVVGLILAASILLSRAWERIGVPVALLFLGVGILAGSEGVGGIAFESYRVAFRIGVLALILILFDGGLNTSLPEFRRWLAPAGVLATLGVLATAAVMALAARAAGLPWTEALLLGAVVSSTDAAAVFAVLRGSGLHLKRRVGLTLEIESGLNDPAAVILTILVTTAALGEAELTIPAVALEVIQQLSIGGASGVACGLVGRRLLAELRLTAEGLYAALTLSLALLAFALPILIGGSGFLSVYVAGLVLGNGALPFRAGLLRVHDALAWLGQISMFVVLGLLVFPSRLEAVAPLGLGLALFLAFVARPVVVAACLAPFRYSRREVGYIAWVGLRGAIPIVLATFPVMAGVPGAQRVFDLVFFIVVVNAFLPGGTVRWLTRRLRLSATHAPAPEAVLTIESRRPLRGHLVSFFVDEALPVAGAPLSELPLPQGASVTLIIRGDELVPPRGSTVLEPGDHVYLASTPEDLPYLQLLFGRPEVE